MEISDQSSITTLYVLILAIWQTHALSARESCAGCHMVLVFIIGEMFLDGAKTMHLLFVVLLSASWIGDYAKLVTYNEAYC